MVQWLNHPIGKRLDITPLLITHKVVLLIQMSNMWSSDHLGVRGDMWLWQGHLRVTKSRDCNLIMWSWLDHVLWWNHVTQEYHFEGLGLEITILQVAVLLQLWIVMKLDIGLWQYDIITQTTPLSTTSGASTKTPQRRISNRRKDFQLNK